MMDPRGWGGFQPGLYEYQHVQNEHQQLAKEVGSNSKGSRFSRSRRSVIVRTVVTAVVVIVLALLYFGLWPH